MLKISNYVFVYAMQLMKNGTFRVKIWQKLSFPYLPMLHHLYKNKQHIDTQQYFVILSVKDELLIDLALEVTGKILHFYKQAIHLQQKKKYFNLVLKLATRCCLWCKTFFCLFSKPTDALHKGQKGHSKITWTRFLVGKILRNGTYLVTLNMDI